MQHEGLLYKQARRLLLNNRLALLAVIVLMLVPYTAWLGMSVLALVTLRHGVKQGTQLVIPAFTAHVIVLLFSASVNLAVFDGFIRIVPCYLVASLLRLTSSWKIACLGFFAMMVVLVSGLHLAVPELVNNQFLYFQSIIRQLDSNSTLLRAIITPTHSVFVLSNYLVGIQLICLFISTLSSVCFARLIQSRLFYPGGFYREMLSFRGDKYSVIGLGLFGIAAHYHQAIAMNCLPWILFYFVLTGLSLCAHLLSGLKPFRMLMVLCLPCMLLPLFALPFYIVLGSADSVFNFRLYLTKKTDKKT